MEVLKLIAVLAIGLAIIAVPTSLASSATTGTNATSSEIPEFLSVALSNPKVLVVILIQFLLGLGLGYFSVKVVKYVLALIGILVLGLVLSVWSLGGSLEEFITNLGAQVQIILPLIKNVLTTLGLMTVGPVTIGFIIGVIAGLIKK